MSNFWKRRREEMGLTQRQIGNRLGRTDTIVGMWESDKALPSDPIKKLAEAYEVSDKIISREWMAQKHRMEAKRAEQEATAS